MSVAMDGSEVALSLSKAHNLDATHQVSREALHVCVCVPRWLRGMRGPLPTGIAAHRESSRCISLLHAVGRVFLASRHWRLEKRVAACHLFVHAIPLAGGGACAHGPGGTGGTE